MATLTNTQEFANVTVSFTNQQGQPANVDGVPVWASSDPTIVSVEAGADGMSAKVGGVAPGTGARITVTADADTGQGITTITGVSEDIEVTADTSQQASLVTLNLGTATAKA